MFDWNKKEAPLKALAGMGGGVGRGGGAAVIDATGGTVIEEGDYQIHVFTSNDTLTIGPGGPYDVDYLVVAGGGSGGSGGGPGGGGGGAGGLLTGSSLTLNVGNHSITVGAGGVWAEDGASPGNSGYPSQLGSLVQAWGGGHGGQRPISSTGANGGSGGGGRSGDNSFPGNGPGGSGNRQTNTGTSVPQQGYPGGNSATPGNCAYCGSGGGGGGAGQAGSPAPDTRGGGTGGNGLPISWMPPSYGTPGPSPGRWFAGGGGGKSRSDSGNNWPVPVAPGGAGGGGNGAGNNTASSSGTANTGGGGGGRGGGASATANGGSGIVAVRFQR